MHDSEVPHAGLSKEELASEASHDPKTQLGLLERLDLELGYGLEPEEPLPLPCCLPTSFSLGVALSSLWRVASPRSSVLCLHHTASSRAVRYSSLCLSLHGLLAHPPIEIPHQSEADGSAVVQ